MIVYEMADRDKKDREIRFFNSNVYFVTYLIIPHYKFLIEIFRLNDLLLLADVYIYNLLYSCSYKYKIWSN